ncbi:MAG: hypothetical protein AMS15_02050 [Planctomycetes bacterium DG_23]|nr:MAG: hypothetical protein AMS15_02050 [Planctomycetes bacterium DG_23]
MQATEDEVKKVEEIIAKIAQKKKTDYVSAKRMAHKYVCRGKCNWYKTKSKQAGFKMQDVTPSQAKSVEEAIKEVVSDLSLKQASRLIHRVIC